MISRTDYCCFFFTSFSDFPFEFFHSIHPLAWPPLTTAAAPLGERKGWASLNSNPRLLSFRMPSAIIFSLRWANAEFLALGVKSLLQMEPWWTRAVK